MTQKFVALFLTLLLAFRPTLQGDDCPRNRSGPEKRECISQACKDGSALKVDLKFIFMLPEQNERKFTKDQAKKKRLWF